MTKLLRKMLFLLFWGGMSVLSYGQQNEMIIITQQPLPYGYNELEPIISAETLILHYGKHLKGYIDNVNKIIKDDTEKYGTNLESIVKNSTGKLYNNAAQAWNHNFYFVHSHPKTKHNTNLLEVWRKPSIINGEISTDSKIHSPRWPTIYSAPAGYGWQEKTMALLKF